MPGDTENAVPEDHNPGTPDAVLCQADGPVAVLTINRPAAKARTPTVTSPGPGSGSGR